MGMKKIPSTSAITLLEAVHTSTGNVYFRAVYSIYHSVVSCIN